MPRTLHFLNMLHEALHNHLANEEIYYNRYMTESGAFTYFKLYWKNKDVFRDEQNYKCMNSQI